MNASIRSACAADIPGMHRVRLSVRENRLSGSSDITEASYLPYVEAGGAWVAERAGEIVAFAVLDASTKSVWALFVAPDAEGAGLGRRLHDRMLGRAEERGIPALWLTTAEGTRAARFYAMAGWQREGVTAEGEVRLRKNVGTEVAASGVTG
jgi:GNAT superfamily N-acetyltransferase